MNNLALGYRAAGKLHRALPLFEETLKRVQAKQGADHPLTLTTRRNLAVAYVHARKLDRALPHFREAALGVERRGFAVENAGGFVSGLIGWYEWLGQLDQAEPWRQKWLAVVKAQSGADSAAYAAELTALGSNLLRQKKWAEAELALRDCLAIREKKEPDAWATSNTRLMLGGA